jgi:hypothetical protein
MSLGKRAVTGVSKAIDPRMFPRASKVPVKTLLLEPMDQTISSVAGAAPPLYMGTSPKL